MRLLAGIVLMLVSALALAQDEVVLRQPIVITSAARAQMPRCSTRFCGAPEWTLNWWRS